MTRAWMAVFALVVGLGFAVPDAHAVRLGGGKSFGMQRNTTSMPRQATGAAPSAPSAPSQSATAPQPTPTPAPQPAGMGRWLGPIAGLAAGVGLAALLSHFGLSEGFASSMMMALLAAAVFFVIRLLFRRPQPVEYAGVGRVEPAAFQPPPATGGGALQDIPAGFDTEGFLRQAKLNFVRLQAANDTKNIEDIRHFTTPEVFAEARLQMQERGESPQQTDVVTLNAELREVVQEGSDYVASVRFFGTIRESEGAAPQAFDEAWHLTKPVDGSRGWLVAGIQQMP